VLLLGMMIVVANLRLSDFLRHHALDRSLRWTADHIAWNDNFSSGFSSVPGHDTICLVMTRSCSNL